MTDLDLGAIKARLIGYRDQIYHADVYDLIAEVERQGKALSAVAELCDEYEATYDLRPALDALERGNGEEEDMAADYVMLAEIVRVLRAALAQTEPQP
jgi:hypothetical protein